MLPSDASLGQHFAVARRNYESSAESRRKLISSALP